MFTLKKLIVDMFHSVFRTVFVVAPHGILAGVSAAGAFSTKTLKRLGFGVSWHDALAVTLGTAYSFLLIFLPPPTAPRPLRLGELGRGLVELFALGSHNTTLLSYPRFVNL